MIVEKVSLGFAQGSVAEVVETALAVNDNLYRNPNFATPPVTEAELQTAREAVESAQGAMAQGGTADTATRDQLLDVLVALLRTLAGYVQEESKNNLAKLLSSGFKAVSKNHAREVLGVPQLVKLNGGIAGQLKAASTRPPPTGTTTRGPRTAAPICSTTACRSRGARRTTRNWWS